MVGAERLMCLVRPGTHDWNKFVVPNHLEAMLEESKIYLPYTPNSLTRKVYSRPASIFRRLPHAASARNVVESNNVAMVVG